MISVAGEPNGSGSEECGKAATISGLTDFYARTLDYLATLDPNHLRSTGGLLHIEWGLPGTGIDGPAIVALAANTLPALHTYTGDYNGDGDPPDGQTPTFGPAVTALGKPWFTEEFGWKQSLGDAKRAGYYAWLYDEQTTYGSDGALFWNLGLEQGGESHDVNPSTPLTWAEVQGELGRCRAEIELRR